MHKPVDLILFGSPQVRCNGSLITDFRTSKAQALLYYLAVSGRPPMRSSLAGLLWGNQPEVAARASLSKCLLSGSGTIIGGKMQFDIAFPCVSVGDNAFASKLGVMTFADEQEGQMQVIKGVNAIYRRRS